MKHLYGLLFLLVVLIGSSVQPGQRIWEVTCWTAAVGQPFSGTDACRIQWTMVRKPG
ncbi:MAG: hypothetical protein OXD45_00975 [Rhodobacteraceae bacterium]|nr:hypothetical protein [Paracoccaceae bacterium]